jgi:hypothetical protein
MKKVNVIILGLIAAVIFAGSPSCKKKNSKSGACDIVSFTVGNDQWQINGTDITFTYPKSTPETALTPVIVVSGGATVSPPSNTAQNLFAAAGVSYTVTAEDGATTKTYKAKATRASN